MPKLAFVLAALSALLASCQSGRARCDPADPDACAQGERCVAEGQGGYCEALSTCDTADPTSCPSGFLCRPVGDGAYCEPGETAGRIPSCIDSEGIDVFAVEANSALSVT